MAKAELRCEVHKWRDGLPCGAVARWLVGVGSRKTDAMLSCGRHLNEACTVMTGHEGRRAALTVTPAAAVDLVALAAVRGMAE